ncbi:inositol monophosphatase [Candidatus Roizmanbacteria bacterium]|jgi:myo-inositol-1(or 4)-monophosphatase|nr:inositol monophosphatase [Candidatus Roizmanbacteria bacterium]
MLLKEEIEEYRKFGERIVREAGKILLEHKKNFKIEKRKKDFFDIATDADREVEEYLITKIKKQYPHHSTLAEESGLNYQPSDFQWIIDPLDGTKEYIRNSPYYGTILALEFQKKPIFGLFYQPEINNTAITAKGLGTIYNGSKYQVSNEKTLLKSFINIRVPDTRLDNTVLTSYMDVLNKIIRKSYRVRSETWDIQALVFVSIGDLEGFAIPIVTDKFGPRWHDVVAGFLMVEEAGGKVTDIYGHPITNQDLSKGIVASNKRIHNQLLNLVEPLRLKGYNTDRQ